MKKIFSLFVTMVTCSLLFAQGLPSINIKDLHGKSVNTNSIKNEEGPLVISFWATWCKPCIQELLSIADEYEDWQEETGVKFYAISIDDSRTTNKVAPFINGKGWEYEVLLDANCDFKRAMNVNNVPHTFLLNKKGEVVWQHNSYSPGDEEELYEKIVALSEGKEL